MEMSIEIGAIAEAISKFQEEVKNPTNNAKNPQYRSEYATLDNVINTVKPILAKHGLSYIQSPATLEDGLHIGITTLLMHKSGQYIKSDPLILPAFKLGKDSVKIYDAQAAGIAVSYGRRYSLSAILGISSENDDDGNGISHQTNHKKDNQQPQQSNNGPKTLSPPQLKLLNTLITRMDKEKGLPRETVIETLRKKDGIGMFDSTANLTSVQASKAIKTLQNALGDEQ